MSTWKAFNLPIFFALVLLTCVSPAQAAATTFAVVPFDYKIPNVGRGMADILTTAIATGHLKAIGQKHTSKLCEESGISADELLTGGDPETLKLLAGTVDYLVVGEVVAFQISDKDQPIDLGAEFNDLGRLVGQGSDSAHVALDVRLICTADGETVANWLLEGIESRNGIRMKSITYGWAGSVDMQSDEFRETMIGRAAYKALGQVIYNLYDLFPVEGAVIAVSGDAVVIDLDESSGVAVGTELTIVRRAVITTAEGVTAWIDDRPVGRVEIIEFQPGRCLCLTLEGNGDISEGDIAIPVIASYILPQYVDVDD